MARGGYMNTDRPLGRYLGIAFLVVFTGSALSEALSRSVFDGSTADTLRRIGEDPTQMRWSTMIELCITSVGIVVLAILLYAVLRKQNPLLALVALGWWLAEAITLAISTVGAFLLVPLGEAYVEADPSALPHLLALGDTLLDFDRFAWEVHNVFFALGGVLWYYLMYQSRLVPRWLSIWGLLAVPLVLISSLLLLAADVDLFFLGFPTGLLEVVLGIWLVVRGDSWIRPTPEPGISDGSG